MKIAIKNLIAKILLLFICSCGPADLFRDLEEERKNNCERAVLVTSAYYADEQLVNSSKDKEKSKNEAIAYLLISCLPAPGE